MGIDGWETEEIDGLGTFKKDEVVSPDDIIFWAGYCLSEFHRDQ